ncbi:uncharacterized protein LOC141639782 [Silene latifolia]|uniref:uncharacterized protein LOC141639782 n=1 Tax=Silene latifolia TaxID=37657 RepID=UPI003D78A6BB
MPTHVTQYRHIACYNVLYKCISKIFCTRLAGGLPDVISINQDGFIRGRSIIENILVCQDLVRLYNRQACTPRCMFKMDLMKAYDSISWQYVGEILEAFYSPPHFRKLVMECISSASFSISINGETFGFFPGNRGLRQGDPMSPLLFTLCMEYLSRILHCATEKLKFIYHPMCKQLKLTHLMFIDDLLVFCKGGAHSTMVLLRAYCSFSVASSLKMNAQKSCAYFNGLVSGLKKELLTVSGFQEVRIRSLGAQKLSYASRLVLVSFVLSTLHTYWATMFVIPKGVMERVDEICRNFLWEGSTEHNKASVIAWSKVCVPKKEGGLGLKKSEKWNIALIGKLKKICKVRDQIEGGFVDRDWSIGTVEYTVKICYNWIRDKHPDVRWNKAIWNKMSAPKHSFISYLISHNALMLKDRLFQYHVVAYNLYCICQLQLETHKNLFSECSFSRQVLQRIGDRLCCDMEHSSCLLKIAAKRWIKIRKDICTAAVTASWYFIWMQRNEARLQNKV